MAIHFMLNGIGRRFGRLVAKVGGVAGSGGSAPTPTFYLYGF